MGAVIASCQFSFCTDLPQFLRFIWMGICLGMELKLLALIHIYHNLVHLVSLYGIQRILMMDESDLILQIIDEVVLLYP